MLLVREKSYSERKCFDNSETQNELERAERITLMASFHSDASLKCACGVAPEDGSFGRCGGTCICECAGRTEREKKESSRKRVERSKISVNLQRDSAIG